MTASATLLPAAVRPATDSNSTTAQLPMMRFAFIRCLLGSIRPPRVRLQVLEPTCAVADAVLMNVEPVQQAEQQIPRGYGPGRIRQMTPALQLPAGATD